MADHTRPNIGMRPFERSLPMALMRAREASMRLFRPALAAHGLTEQQWRVLRALSDDGGGLEVGQLADTTHLLGPSLSRILAKLEQRGLLTRATVVHDGRRARIAITDSGLELVRQIAPLSESAYRAIEERFGAARLAELLDLLDDLASTTVAAVESEEVTR